MSEETLSIERIDDTKSEIEPGCCEGKSADETFDHVNAHSKTFVLQRLEEHEPLNVYRIHSITKNRTQ